LRAIPVDTVYAEDRVDINYPQELTV